MFYNSSTSARGVKGAHTRVRLSVRQSRHTPELLNTDSASFCSGGGGVFVCGNSCKAKFRASSMDILFDVLICMNSLEEWVGLLPFVERVDWS